MSILHERPGVYSSYDTSSVVSTGHAAKIIGVAAKAKQGTINRPVSVSSFPSALAAFGEDLQPGMSSILRLLFTGGASSVCAVRVPDEAALDDYQAAFDALGKENVQIIVCDSPDADIQKALRTAVEDASALRHERIAVVGCDSDDTDALIQRAAELNSERVVLVGPNALDSAGKPVSGVFAAAAVAALAASAADPAVPINGGALKGLTGLSTDFSDAQIDLLVRGGVTPLEASGGSVSPVRGITTRTSTGGAPDAAWRELSTTLILDDVIPAVRSALRAKFARSKNNPRARAAIRSQVIVELEKKRAAEIIDSYDNVSVSPSDDDPTVCIVQFAFSVAHGLNQIHLTVHIEI